jgi:hypothetical protein
MMENNKNPWKLVLIAALIFFAGSMTCIGTFIFFQYLNGPPFPFKGPPPKLISELTRELSLNQEQAVQIEQIINQAREDMHDLRRSFRPEMTKIVKQTKRKINTVLDEQQQEKFKKNIEKRLRRFDMVRERFDKRPGLR